MIPDPDSAEHDSTDRDSTNRDSTSITSTGAAIGRVTIATVVAAASGYLVLLLAARHLGAAGYGVFAVFWASYGMVTGTQNGQLQETARASRARTDTRNDLAGNPTEDIGDDYSHATASRPLPVNVLIGIGIALLVALSSPLWAGRIFTDQAMLSVALLAVGVASFAVYAHLSGALSGLGSWTVFAVLLCCDALIRLVGAVVAVAAGWGLTAFLIITVIGSVSWMVILASSSTARRIIGLPGDVDTRTLTTNTLTAMAAAAAAAVLVMGFPVLINLTGHADDDAGVLGAVVLAVTLTRAPLLVPLNSFQGFLITRFVDARHRLFAALAGPVLVVVLIGGLGAVLAWTVGPWLLTTVFGGDFRLAGVTVAALTVGATTLAVLTITGAAAIAVGRHRFYAAGWWVATAVSIIVLMLPLELTARVSVALIAGPVVGGAVHLWGMRRASIAPARA